MSAFVEKEGLPGYTYKTEPVNDETIALERASGHTLRHTVRQTATGFKVLRIF